MSAPNGNAEVGVSLPNSPLVYGAYSADPALEEVRTEILGEEGDSGVMEVTAEDISALDEVDYPTGEQRMYDLAKHARRNNWIDAHITGELPEQYQTRIEDLRASDIGSLVSIECRVTDRTEQYALVGEAVFRCKGCRDLYEHRQVPDSLELDVPSCDCGGGQSNMELEREMSELIDTQQLIVQDLHTASSTPDPADIRVNVHNLLVHAVEPGETVTLHALVRATKNEKRKAMKSDLFLQAVGVEHHNEDYRGVEVSAEDEERIHELAESDDAYERLTASIAPSLSGDHSLARRALVYQLFGAVSHAEGNEKHREQIHVALVGDPGSGKSSMGRYVEELAPNAVYQSADNVTEVGLTAAVSREERFDSSEWTLSGGTLVRADGGLAVIDELDKAPESIQSSLQEPLSEQQVSVSKGPISATLPARCSALLIANPEGERFTSTRSIADQINIKPAIWDRMDVIIPFWDRPDESKDEEMADAILDRAMGKSPDYIDPELIRKWVAYARENVEPEMTDEAREYIKEEWVSLRGLSDGNRVAVGPRQLDSLIRLSEASARVRLSDTVDEDDAERAVHLMTRWMSLLMTDTNGNWDVDVVSGRSSGQRDVEDAMWAAISELDEGDGAARSAVVDEMMDATDIERADAQQAINKFVGRGELKQDDGKLCSADA